jgi:hypothetical protein
MMVPMSEPTPRGTVLVKRHPVVLSVVPTVADTWTFPREAVEEMRPRSRRVLTGLVLGLLLGALLLPAASAVRIPGLDLGTSRLIGFGLALIPTMLIHLRGHPVGLLLGAVIGAVGAAVTGGGVPAVGTALLFAVPAWPSWAGYRAREQWWPRLSVLLDDSRRVEGRVVARSMSSTGPTVRYTVGSPDVPGRTWWVDATLTRDMRATLGSPVVLWLSPADPAVAVIQMSSDLVGLGPILRSADGH